ncbi:hypothetical protein ABIA14_004114 [Sinorhizobium fredii]
MEINAIPFGITDWAEVEATEHKGETGVAYWRTRQFGPIRVRVVEYTPGYLADHWCSKGHILYCLEGELQTELPDGRRFVLKTRYELSGGRQCRASPFIHVGWGKAVRRGLRGAPTAAAVNAAESGRRRRASCHSKGRRPCWCARS